MAAVENVTVSRCSELTTPHQIWTLFNWNVSNSKKSLISLISLMEHSNIRNFVDDLSQISTKTTFSTKIYTICKNERRTPMKHTYFTTCPYCGATLDPGERCDCPRASPGGYPYGNRTDEKVQPSLPGLPPIVFSHGKPRKEKAE